MLIPKMGFSITFFFRIFFLCSSKICLSRTRCYLGKFELKSHGLIINAEARERRNEVPTTKEKGIQLLKAVSSLLLNPVYYITEPNRTHFLHQQEFESLVTAPNLCSTPRANGSTGKSTSHLGPVSDQWNPNIGGFL